MGSTLENLDDGMKEDIIGLGLSPDEQEKVARIVGCDVVTLHTTDVDGRSVGLPIPGRQFLSSMKHGSGIDGSSVKGFGRGVHESDMWMAPDLQTGLVLPWKNPMDRSMGRVVADLKNADGTDFEGDPRGILKKQLKRASDMGFDFIVAPELEFFVFPTDESGKPVPVSEGNTTYYAHIPGQMADIRNEMMIKLKECGLDIEAGHPEVADNQHEINFSCGNALEQADRVLLFKDVVKEIARRHNHHATFMAKPIAGVNGSGMHTNMSLGALGGDENLFYDEGAEDKLSVLTKQFIAGIMAHIDAITAVANPTVNSYRRLIPGFEAPVYTSWGYSNRSSLIRVPGIKNPKATRIELRSPDPTCNPYLAFAVILAAGIDGIEKEMVPPAPRKEDVFKLSPKELAEFGIGTLPTSLKSAVEFLERDEVVRDALGEHTYQSFLKSRMAEWMGYKQRVSREEFSRYASDF